MFDLIDSRRRAGTYASLRVSVLVAGALAFSFAGCGSEAEISEEHRASPSEPEQRPPSESVSESDPGRDEAGDAGDEHRRESGPERGGEHERAGEHSGEREHGRESEHGEEAGESGTRYGVSETARETRNQVELTLRFDASAEAFVGTVTNTGPDPVSQVRVEVHLSDGPELGPTPRITLAPGETSSVRLEAEGQRFEAWTTHVEIGEGEHGERHR